MKPHTNVSHLAWLSLQPDSADRWFHSQQTSDGCPDFPVHSSISPNVEEATWGTVILDSILTDEGERVWLSSSQSVSHASFHLVLLTTKEKMEVCS